MEPPRPKYPVINPDASVGEALKNFNRRDWAVVAGAVVASMPFGYYFGKPVRIPSMWMAATLGGLGAVFYGLQNSFGRLEGLLPNDEDIAKRRHARS